MQLSVLWSPGTAPYVGGVGAEGDGGGHLGWEHFDVTADKVSGGLHKPVAVLTSSHSPLQEDLRIVPLDRCGLRPSPCGVGGPRRQGKVVASPREDMAAAGILKEQPLLSVTADLTTSRQQGPSLHRRGNECCQHPHR